MKKQDVLDIFKIKKLRSYLLEHANGNIYYFAILVGLSLGLRIGEVTGLQFGDFDINSKMVSISRTAQRVAVLDSNNNVVKTRINIGTTKTKSSTRKLPVPQIILDLLVNTYAPNKSLTSYIFSSKFSDKPLDNRLLRNHYFVVLEKLSLPKITFHGLRHSFASNCIASNIDVKTTSSMLGHSDIKMTLEIYTHPSHEQQKQAINKLGKLFTSKQNT
ncbi:MULTISPECIES: site-specific integrase [unclassified Myroides]|uniref:site-specific integrase n=1 Tax=unclassified Myroides TaxID=2642485 RepID=UPI003D2F53CA